MDHEYMAPDIRSWQTHFKMVAEPVRMEATYKHMTRSQNDVECGKNNASTRDMAACREEWMLNYHLHMTFTKVYRGAQVSPPHMRNPSHPDAEWA